MGAFHVSSTTVPFNLTGHPALSMRFGTSSDGMPIGVQLAANPYAESTILHIASLLETLSPARDQHPRPLTTGNRNHTTPGRPSRGCPGVGREPRQPPHTHLRGSTRAR
ncbi:amidase family protein [Streptomyces sp. NPDC055681]